MNSILTMSARSPSPRRSGRKRIKNRKYISDTFDTLNEIPGSPEAQQQELWTRSKVPVDEEFTIDEILQESEHDDCASMGEGSDVEGSVEGTEAVEDDISDMISIASDNQVNNHSEQGSQVPNPLTTSSKVKRPYAKPRFTGRPAIHGELHSRGVRYVFDHAARDLILAYSFGGTEEDILPLLKARDKWFGEFTIPSRQVNNNGTGGMGYSFYQSTAARSLESQQGWDWFFQQGGRSAFYEAQKFERLEPQESKVYLPQPASSQPFLAGVYSRQQLFALEPSQTMSLDLAYSPANNAKDHTAESSVGVSGRRGWLINLGYAVNCLGWAPNQDGPLQYLAVSTICKDLPLSSPSPRGNTIPSQQDIAPAFAPAPLTPASIQLWEVKGLTERRDVASIDTSVCPKLRLVICSDWGKVKQFKWCPSLRGSGRGGRMDKMRYLGMLAVLYGDGKIRVVDVNCPDASEASTQYIKISNIAFESCPPNTVCTCITWLSSTHIAAGCANGYVAIWDIREHLLNPDRPEIAFPTLYQPIHNTYILAMTSCQPSRPHLLLTSSVEGHIRLTSLHDPRTDHITSSRFRAGIQALVWQDHTQHALFADDGKNVRALNVRKIYQSLTVAIQDAFVLSIATSPVHPCVLVGGADGTVTAFNPIRKILSSKTRQSNYRQVWFKHEWRRGKPINDVHDQCANGASYVEQTDTQSTSDNTNNNITDNKDANANNDLNNNPTNNTEVASNAVQTHPGTNGVQEPIAVQQLNQTTTPTPPPHQNQTLDYPTGLSRFTTGFAIENVKDPAKDRAAKSNALAAGPGVITATIHEEETGVRCLSWNPNLHVGGWAAAGLCSGFMWVEDLAWDRVGDAGG